MTDSDTKFMRELGIVPCSVDDPSPDPLPSSPPTEAPIPKLTAEDARWLQHLGAMWEQETEPEFVPPQSLAEYLNRFPTGVRQAVGEVAKELGLLVPDGDLDDLAQEIVQMFWDFHELGLEDVVLLFGFHRSLCPGGLSFPDYIRMRVKACVETVINLDPTRGRNWRNCI